MQGMRISDPPRKSHSAPSTGQRACSLCPEKIMVLWHPALCRILPWARKERQNSSASEHYGRAICGAASGVERRLLTQDHAGIPKADLARAYGISRETVYQYLRQS